MQYGLVKWFTCVLAIALLLAVLYSSVSIAVAGAVLGGIVFFTVRRKGRTGVKDYSYTCTDKSAGRRGIAPVVNRSDARKKRRCDARKNRRSDARKKRRSDEHTGKGRESGVGSRDSPTKELNDNTVRRKPTSIHDEFRSGDRSTIHAVPPSRERPRTNTIDVVEKINRKNIVQDNVRIKLYDPKEFESVGKPNVSFGITQNAFYRPSPGRVVEPLGARKKFIEYAYADSDAFARKSKYMIPKGGPQTILQRY